MRALLVGLLVAAPSLLLGALAESIEVAVLLSIIVSVVTFLEYNTSYPSFVEFRDAPPINRLRFVALFIMVFVASIIVKHAYTPTNLTGLVAGIGQIVGRFLDFPYSPVRMILLMSPEAMTAQTLLLVRAIAGLVFVIGALAVLAFYLAIRLFAWPVASGAFNVWINLPLFDPTTGCDVVRRLQRDARINLVIGVLLPFLLPALIRLAAGMGMPVMLTNPHVLIWTVCAWAFLPTSLIIRGLALQRVAELIEAKRKRAYASAEHMQTA